MMEQASCIGIELSVIMPGCGHRCLAVWTWRLLVTPLTPCHLSSQLFRSSFQSGGSHHAVENHGPSFCLHLDLRKGHHIHIFNYRPPVSPLRPL